MLFHLPPELFYTTGINDGGINDGGIINGVIDAFYYTTVSQTGSVRAMQALMWRIAQ